MTEDYVPTDDELNALLPDETAAKPTERQWPDPELQKKWEASREWLKENYPIAYSALEALRDPNFDGGAWKRNLPELSPEEKEIRDMRRKYEEAQLRQEMQKRQDDARRAKLKERDAEQVKIDDDFEKIMGSVKGFADLEKEIFGDNK